MSLVVSAEISAAASVATCMWIPGARNYSRAGLILFSESERTGAGTIQMAGSVQGNAVNDVIKTGYMVRILTCNIHVHYVEVLSAHRDRLT